MGKKLGFLIGGILLLGSLILGILGWLHQPKIAYVRSQDLVYGYSGMKEMQTRFQEQTQAWQSNLDTLKFDYQRSLSNYQEDYDGLSKEERELREQLLSKQQNNVMQYHEAITSKMKEEEEKMLEGVLNQVNSFAQEYGRKHNYDIIMGTTLSGSILYGDDALDITDKILGELNQQFKGEE